jgi:hypothetical protein
MEDQQAKVPGKYIECYVAFLDILGMKDLTKRSQKDLKVLEGLVDALDEVATLYPGYKFKQDIVRDENGKIIDTSNPRCWVVQSRFFSDCICLFVPTESDCLQNMMSATLYLHHRFLKLGYCLRGAVTIGEMYWDDLWSCEKQIKESSCRPEGSTHPLITFGPGLTDAYQLESEVAIYPRVVISPGLMKHMKRMLNKRPSVGPHLVHESVQVGFFCSFRVKDRNQRSILDFIQTDFDGVPFLDAFHQDLNRDYSEGTTTEKLDDGRSMARNFIKKLSHEDFMKNTRPIIEKLLNPSKGKVRQKYQWLAKYFNSSLGDLQIDQVQCEWRDGNGDSS